MGFRKSITDLKFAGAAAFVLFAGGLSAAPVLAAQSPQAGLPFIEEYFVEQAKRGFSGVVLIALDGEILLHKGYGFLDAFRTRTMSEKAVFMIGSITKDFTKAVIYLMEGDRRLNLEDTISKHLTGVPKDKQGITIRQLLNGRSGLPDFVNADGKVTRRSERRDYVPVTRDELVERILKAPLQFAPGDGKADSNMAYSLLAALVERVSKNPYERYVRAKIFLPAGMGNTGYIRPKWDQLVLAKGIAKGGSEWGTVFEPARWMKDGPSWNLRGHAGMLTTAKDLYDWTAALRDKKILKGLARERFLADMTKRTKRIKRGFVAGSGDNGVFSAYYMWVIEPDRTIVILSNNGKFPAEKHFRAVFRAFLAVK